MSTSLDYLIPFVRLKIGDTDSTSYRYTDDWISIALIASVGYLSKWWNYKYLLDGEDNVIRNPARSSAFILDEATYGVIEDGDEQIIVVAAAFIILEGSLESSAWNTVSWRDAEISYSNLESARTRGGILNKLWDELTSLLKPPTKRLAQTRKGSLPGYLNNEYEVGKK